MLEPIIKVHMTELNAQMEGDVLKVCHSYGIEVDKERLMQALTDARKFYDEGYRDGRSDAVEVVRCEDCKAWQTETAMSFLRDGVHVRCCSCNVFGRLMYDDDFCSKGERRVDDEPQ